MRLYIAGLYTSHFGRHSNIYRSASQNLQALRDTVHWHLESYHYIHKGNYVMNIDRDGVKVFLDSGAFSAFSLGVDVDIGAYAEFIRENQKVIDMASVLDAIGDHEATLKNQQDLERRGCPVLPCFHFGEPLDLCEYYVSNYEYITIGGMVPIPNEKLEPWLDNLWEKVLTDKDGFSRIKIHGFGLTSRKLMVKYPWFSVDSSSWVQQAANGLIRFPELDTGIMASSASPARKQFGRHLDTYPPQVSEYIDRLLDHYGLTREEVQNNYKARWALNAFSYHEVGRRLGDDHHLKPFKARQPLLF